MGCSRRRRKTARVGMLSRMRSAPPSPFPSSLTLDLNRRAPLAPVGTNNIGACGLIVFFVMVTWTFHHICAATTRLLIASQYLRRDVSTRP